MSLRELGRECQGRVLRLSWVLEAERLDADEVFTAIRTNGSVWCELDFADFRHINTGVQRLESCLEEV